MNLQEQLNRIQEMMGVDKQPENGGGIFYHNSDKDIEYFTPQLRDVKKSQYLFFSNEPNTFLSTACA